LNLATRRPSRRYHGASASRNYRFVTLRLVWQAVRCSPTTVSGILSPNSRSAHHFRSAPVLVLSPWLPGVMTVPR
jgi:hypothetical protein